MGFAQGITLFAEDIIALLGYGSGLLMPAAMLQHSHSQRSHLMPAAMLRTGRTGRVHRSMTNRLPVGLIGLVSLCIGTLAVFDGWASRDVKDWHEFGDMNQALRWVGQREDATGLILTGFWWDTAGYTALHKPIPVVYAVEDETLEVQPHPMAMLGYKCDADFPDKFSPTYWEYAKKGVVHVYLSMSKYNYLALPNTEKNKGMEGTFKSFGFRKVQSFPKATVYFKPIKNGRI